jgi:MoaA/NifB/PqqE/SkfB family radical SAM enzyme
MISADGNVQPCAYRGSYTNVASCQPFGNLNLQSLETIWNSPEAQKIRAAMAQGDLDTAGCGRCLAVAQGQALQLEYDLRSTDPSYAETPYVRNMNIKRQEILHGAVFLESKPTVISYTPDHRCNLRCRHCFQNISRRMRIERPGADDDVVTLLPVLSDIVAGGGEPLLITLWRRMLKSYDPALNPFLRFSTTTNANVLNRQMAEEIDKFQRLQIIVSLDGADREVYEHIRRHARWCRFQKNARTLRDLVANKGFGSLFAFNISVMKSNIARLPDLIRYCAQEVSGFNFQPVVGYPLKESLRCFNDPEKEALLWEGALTESERVLQDVFFPAMHAAAERKSQPLYATFEDLYRGHLRALQGLIPWDLLSRRHYPIRIALPKENLHRAAVIGRILTGQQKEDVRLQIAFFEMSGDGESPAEPRHWAYLGNEGRIDVHLPDGRFLMAIAGEDYPVIAPDENDLYQLVIQNGRPSFRRALASMNLKLRFKLLLARFLKRA